MAAKPNPNYTLNGRITNLQDEPLAGLVVRAFDQDPRSADDPLGQAVTDLYGAYTLRFKEEQFKPSGKESGGPDVFIRVFDGAALLGESPVQRNAKKQISINLQLDYSQEEPDDTLIYVVRGRITQPNGNPIPGVLVLFLNKKLLAKDDVILGEVETDVAGAYEVKYVSKQDMGADLLIRVLDQYGEVVVTSPLIIEAAKEQIVDLVVDHEAYPDLPEVEQIQQRLQPFLKGADLAELDNESVALLAGLSRVNPLNIAYLVQANRLAKATGIEPEAFYALLRANQPVSLPALVVQDQATQKQALEEAAKANIISQKVADKVDSVLKTLAAQRVELLLQQPDLPVGSTSLGGVLDVAALDDNQKRTFVEKFAATNSTSQAFWDELAQDDTFDEAATQSVKLAIRLGTLTQNNEVLMKSLHQQLSKNGQDLRGLVGRNEAQWLHEIRQHTDRDGNVLLPPNLLEIEGQITAETYAQTMVRMVEATFPTPSITAVLERNDFSGADIVKDFLNQHNEIEFRDQNIRVFLRDNNISLSDEGQEQIFAFKRIFDLAPTIDRYQAMRPLLQDGLTSAYVIRKMGEKKFRTRYASAMGVGAAQHLYQAASQKSAVATALFAANSPLVNNLGLHVLPDGNLGTVLDQDSQNLDVDLPTWERLFGSISFCSCKHCRSVYSPAAYLVDLLAFLREQKTGNLSALEVLFKQRGDIGQIKLNCHNTNTTLPYVDLVIEVLEHYLAHEDANTGDDWWDADEVPQTLGEPKDLRVHPENIVGAAYELLQNQDYPWTLPFNLWTVEMRAYLEPMGVNRAEIIQLMNPHPADALPETVRNDIALETLGLILGEWSIIVGAVAGGLAGWGDSSTIDELRQVKTLMNKGRLSYIEVQHLLDTGFINGNGTLKIEFADDLCDINGATIPALAEQPDADRIHRFMRLQRKVGWSIYDLDAAIDVLGGGNLDETFLRHLAVVKQLHDTLSTPVLTLLSWWGNIDTTRPKNDEDEAQPALYDQLFLNKTVGDETDLETFGLNDNRDELELVNNNHTLEEVKAAILAALKLITDKELSLIIQKRVIAGDLNLANLSELYRVTTLAKALKLSVSDLLYLIDLTDFDPFALANLEALPHTFLDTLHIIKISDFSISELAYILNHDFEADSTYATGNTAIGNFLFKLRTSLKKLKESYPLIDDPSQPGTMTVAPDPTGEHTRLLLTQLVSEEMLEQTMAVIAGTSDENLPGGTQNPLDRNAIVDEQFAFFIDNLPDFKNQFINQGSVDYLDPTSELAARFHTVLEPLTKYLLKINSIALVQQSFADLLDVDLRASDQMLGGVIKAVADSTQPASAVFLDDAFIDSDQDPLIAATFGSQYEMIRRLQKIAFLLNRLNIPSEEVRWLAAESVQVGWLDLNSIPISPNNPDPTRFQAWLRMARFAWLRQQLSVSELSLFTLLRMAHTGQDENNTPVDKTQFIAQLHAATGWNQTDIETLLDADHFDLAFNSQFSGQQALEHLSRLYHSIRLLQRLGVSAEQAWTWAKPDVSREREIAVEIKQAARAKFRVEQWPSVAEPIRDALRLQQRNALVDAALEIARSADIEEIADLYTYFLMDVEMNPCMMTSRIKQAISSVQLFVQRCLMNLEQPDVILDVDAASQWEWMKNYRVWEANRKIFLYPENWIEPELRPDKSPFFVDLENELLQNDVTTETVETAFLNYLEKLDEVARLEIASVYNDEEEAGTLHVLGRTKSIPHKYFYRRWENRRRWTPWEAVPIDVEGDVVTLTRYNRRLYLFWFMTQEKADERGEDYEIKISAAKDNEEEQEVNVPNEKPQKYLEVKLVWSQYRNGKWSAKTLAKPVIKTISREESPDPNQTKTWDANYFRPRPLPDATSDGLLIAVEAHEQILTSNGSWHRSVLNDSQIQDLNNLQTKFNFLLSDTNQVELSSYKNGIETVLESPYSQEVGGIFSARISQEHYVPLIKKVYKFPTVIIPLQYMAYRSQAPLFLETGDHQYFVVPYGGIIRPDLIVSDQLTSDLMLLENLTHPGSRPPIRPPLGVESTVGTRRNQPFVTDTRIVSGLDRIQIPLTRTNLLLATNIYGNGTSPPHTLDDENGLPYGISEEAVNNADWVMFGETTGRNVVSSLRPRYRFHIHYHPYTNNLIKQINKYGIEGLLNPVEKSDGGDLRRQLKHETLEESFKEIFDITPSVDAHNLPVEEFDFLYTGAYTLYNWELFFHAPLLIASRLSANQQFAAAQKWFHYMFDPTDVSTFDDKEDEAYRYWKIKPFFKNRKLDNIRELLKLLSSNDPQAQPKREALETQIADWRDNPFQPHRIAEQRFMAYQKTTIMKYLDNLIAWGDHLFRQDSIESINEATQLYILAAQILGKRQEALPEPKGDQKIDGQIVKTFADLEEHLDKFGNAMVQIENEMSAILDPPELTVDEAPTADILGSALFFCVPKNDKLLGYWDTVADRLFKIRNCMNIEGIVRQINLFEPPIDPALLVRATAAGIDIGSVLNDMKAPRLQYRYSILVQKAVDFCNDVKQLGGALLAALEKRDAEELTLLRSSHEERLLKAIRDVRKLQLKDAEATLAGLEKSLETVKVRHQFYDEREDRIPEENAQLDHLETANDLEILVAGISLLKQIAALFPKVNLGGSGFGGSPVITTETGWEYVFSGLNALSENASAWARHENRQSNMASITASFKRRDEEWEFQAGQAAVEIEALEKQIEGARLRIAIAERELENQELQIEQNREVDEFMRMKFTNRELYSWMVDQISTIYFQSYQLAYDMAMRAQRAYQYELADYDASFINFGYWDSLKKGLLAGEQLHYDLRRMESGYFEANRREYELTKHISLLQLNPAALIQLRETGSCEIDIPEVIFDLDYPGHFLRRIKAVSLTIPCVTGPYTTVNCTLTLLNNHIRVSTDRPNDAYSGFDDDRFVSNVGGDQSIATSTAREDSGLFEFNFRDERYLPFEGAGAVGRWHLELPSEYRQFDYNTIADTVLGVRYTAREGGLAFKTAISVQIDEAVNKLADALGQQGVFHFISMKHELGTAFHKFLNPVGIDEHKTTITLSKQHFPFMFQGKVIDIQNVIVFVKLRDASLLGNDVFALTIAHDGGTERGELKDNSSDELSGLAHTLYTQLSGDITETGDWIFSIAETDVQILPATLRQTVNINGASKERIKADEVEDIGILLQYMIS